jgi:hypothetical protein
MTLPWQVGKLWERLRRNPWMVALFLCFTLFAVSHIVYLGTLQVVEIPLPAPILHLAAIFRSTGRFFWPAMYSIAALAIAAPIPFYGRYGVLLLCLSAPLQWIDTAPLRGAVTASVHAPEKPHIDLAAWDAAIRRHDSIRVLPQNFCLARGRGWNSEIAVQLQLLAAKADRPINSVYAARINPDCRADQKIDGTPQPGTRQLSIFLNEFSGIAKMRELSGLGQPCRAGTDLVVCSDIPEEGPALAALVRTDRK